jgi:hypothetical protein
MLVLMVRSQMIRFGRSPAPPVTARRPEATPPRRSTQCSRPESTPTTYASLVLYRLGPEAGPEDRAADNEAACGNAAVQQPNPAVTSTSDADPVAGFGAPAMVNTAGEARKELSVVLGKRSNTSLSTCFTAGYGPRRRAVTSRRPSDSGAGARTATDVDSRDAPAARVARSNSASIAAALTARGSAAAKSIPGASADVLATAVKRSSSAVELDKLVSGRNTQPLACPASHVVAAAIAIATQSTPQADRGERSARSSCQRVNLELPLGQQSHSILMA